MKTIGLIGTGNIGSAIVRSLAPRSLFTILLNDINQERSLALAEETGSRSVSLDHLLSEADLLVLAVKPQVLPSLYGRLSQAKDKDWVSTAAGISLATLGKNLRSASVARIMPNIAASVGKSFTALAFSPQASESFRREAETLVSSFGQVFHLDENLFSAFTALSGSAIATVFQFLNGLALAGVREGFTYESALRIVSATCLSAVGVLEESGLHPEALVNQVCSPAGTAIESMVLLENRCFKGTLIDSVHAACLRSKELEIGSD